MVFDQRASAIIPTSATSAAADCSRRSSSSPIAQTKAPFDPGARAAPARQGRRVRARAADLSRRRHGRRPLRRPHPARAAVQCHRRGARNDRRPARPNRRCGASRMTRDPRYDILFEPVRIGPVTARNRFYQVPHCTGIGWTQPETLARLRGIKAEGGWAVVATEETEIHPDRRLRAVPRRPAVGRPRHSGDRADGRRGARTWRARGDRDHASRRLGRELGHAHGAARSRRTGRSSTMHPVQARAMDKQDIRDLRQWHRDAALRSKRAGFRHRLRLCDPRSVDRAAIPRAPQERPHRRIWREPREPRAPAARADRGHQGGGRRPLRGRGPLCRRRADRATPA